MDQRRQNVRWDNHQSNLQTMFSYQLEQERFLDITLASQDGQTIKAHRAVLCAASGYFDTVLTNTTVGKETLVILKDINFDEIKQIIEFVYHGEISVEQGQLVKLLKTAESLQIQGLAGALKKYTESVELSPGPSSPKRKRTRAALVVDAPQQPITEVYLPQGHFDQEPKQMMPIIEEAKSLFQLRTSYNSMVTNDKAENAIDSDVEEMSEEADEKYKLWLANQQKLMTTIARIETKLKSLTQRFSRQTPSACNEVTFFNKMRIIDSVGELEALEEKLKSEDFMRSLIESMKSICGQNSHTQGFNCCYTLVDHIFTRKFINTCSWSGNSRTPDLKKTAFKTYIRTIRFFFELVRLADPTFTEMKMQQFFQCIIRNSTRRCTDGPKRQSRARRRRKRTTQPLGNQSNADDAVAEVIELESDEEDLYDPDIYANDDDNSSEIAQSGYFSEGGSQWKEVNFEN